MQPKTITISSKGQSSSSFVLIDGKPLDWVQSVTWTCDVRNNQLAKCNIELLLPSAEFEVLQENTTLHVQIIRPPIIQRIKKWWKQRKQRKTITKELKKFIKTIKNEKTSNIHHL